MRYHNSVAIVNLQELRYLIHLQRLVEQVIADREVSADCVRLLVVQCLDRKAPFESNHPIICKLNILNRDPGRTSILIASRKRVTRAYT